MHTMRPWPTSASSVRPGTPARRRSTACSRHPRARARTRSAPTRSPASDATALDPRLNRNGGKRVPQLRHERRGARARGRRHLPLPLARGGGGDRAARRGASSSTSPARTGCADAGRLRGVVRLHAPAARTSSATGSTGCPSSSPPDGPADREPGLLRDGGAARARAARGRDRPGQRRRRRDVRDDRRGPDAEGRRRTPARARERLAVQGRRAPARRPRSRSCSASRSRSRRTCCPSAAA